MKIKVPQYAPADVVLAGTVLALVLKHELAVLVARSEVAGGCGIIAANVRLRDAAAAQQATYRAIVQAPFWAPLTAFTASMLLVWWLAGSRLSRLLLDRPNPRSLHEMPVPRSGGLGLHAGALLAIAVVSPAFPPALWGALAIVIAVSLIDDVRGVAPALRLAAHFAACGWLAAVVLGDQGPAAVAMATVAMVWMANLFNFMDGSDGLAGGMATIGFFFYGAAAWVAADAELALVCFSIAAAAAAFLVFNFHPARVFLGDAGSVPLGFLAAAFGILGWLRGDWNAWFPFLVFAPFIVDASVTLARRLARLEKVWQAHRDHYYQRLVRMGWGHRRTALAEYAVMIASGALAIVGLRLHAPGQAAMLAAAAVAYVAAIALIERRWSAFRASAPS